MAIRVFSDALHAFTGSRRSISGISTVVCALFILVVLLLAPAANAEIFMHKQSDNSLFFTNDKRKLPDKEKPGLAAKKKSADKQETQSASDSELTPPEQQAAPDTQKSPVATKGQGEVPQVWNAVRQTFSTKNPEPLLSQFHFFEETAPAEQREQLEARIRTFLDLFFETYGAVDDLQEGQVPGDFFLLGRVYGAYKQQWESAQCTWRHATGTGTPENSPGQFKINFSVCDTGAALWLKDINVGFVAPSEAVKQAAMEFKNTYQQRVRSAMRELRTQTGQAAPKPIAEPEPQMQAQTPQDMPQSMPPSLPQDMLNDMPGGFGQDFFQELGSGFLDPMLFMQFFSTTFITGFLLVSLLFQLFYSLCLYIIAKKLRVGAAWMSWIPILQVHPMVLSAGLTGVWTLALFGAFVLTLIPFVGIAISLGILVFMVWIWMSISERLGMNKWLGLLVIVPLAQFIYPAYLAFKSDVYRSNVDIKGVAGRTFLAFLLLGALCWALVLYFVAPMMDMMLNQAFSQPQMEMGAPRQPLQQPLQQPPQQPSGVPLERMPQSSGDEAPAGVAAEPGSQDAPYVSLSREDYEKMLRERKAPGDPNASGKQTRVGPLLLTLDQFWADASSPHLWIMVGMPMIPNLDMGQGGRMIVSKALNSAGKNLYDKDNTFEGEQFEKLSFSKTGFDTPYLQAIRDIRLVAGTKEGDVVTVEGEVQFRLPLNLWNITVDGSQLGKEVQDKDMAVTLQKLDGKDVELLVTGNVDNHLATFAYDGQGNEVSYNFSSWSSQEGRKLLKIQFEKPVAKLECVFATGFLDKSYPVTIRAQ